MTVLLTGGSGFIGSRLAQHFAHAGDQGVILDLAPPAALPDSWRFVQADVRDAGAVKEAAAGCDALFHLAAAHHDRGISPATYFSVNRDGTSAVCEAAAAHGIRRICFFSSVAVYGGAAPPRTEETVPLPIGPYGASKLEGEQVVRKWCAGGPERRAIIIRPTAIIGPGNFANLYALCRQLDRPWFVQVGPGSNVKALGFVDNLVAATVALWGRNGEQPVEVFNYVDKPDLTSREIVAEIRRGLGRGLRGIRIPFRLALLGALPFELGSWLSGRDLGVSRNRIRKFAAVASTFEAGKILAAGFRPPVALREGLRRTVAWYLAEGRHRPPPPRIPAPRSASDHSFGRIGNPPGVDGDGY